MTRLVNRVCPYAVTGDVRMKDTVLSLPSWLDCRHCRAPNGHGRILICTGCILLVRLYDF